MAKMFMKIIFFSGIEICFSLAKYQLYAWINILPKKKKNCLGTDAELL